MATSASLPAIRFADLQAAVSGDTAALRCRRRLQPAGGPGDKIFPPTYPPADEEKRKNPKAPPRHVFERRRINGQEIWCVLVDSVQSQANRLEESLLLAIRDGNIQIPYVTVDFREAKLAGITEITSLEAPHRIYDAILRDSLLESVKFPESELGQRLTKANNHDASALLETSPTSLLFGAWNSTGQGGGLGAKFARCLTSEITAVHVPIEENINPRTGELTGEIQTAGRRTGSRIDPLGTLKAIKNVFKGESGWDITEKGAGKKAKQVRPSEINHGNIAPTIQPLGITCDFIEHVFVLSLTAIRRLHFGSTEKDNAGQSYLAALGMLAYAEQEARGYALRSRCDLVCDGHAPLEWVKADGATAGVTLDRATAKTIYTAALQHAQKAGFNLSAAPIRLQPQDKLIDIIRQSQQLALQGQAGDETTQDE